MLRVNGKSKYMYFLMTALLLLSGQILLPSLALSEEDNGYSPYEQFFDEDEDQSKNKIERIEITGNKRISSETIISYAQVQKSMQADQELISNIVRKLFATELFADIRVSFVKRVLTIQVVENAIINRIVFEGNSNFDDEALLLEVNLRPRVVFNRRQIRQATLRLLQIYRSSGRFSASVVPKAIYRADNRVDIIFEIEEGPVSRIARIDFINNKHFSDDELKDNILSEESAWYSIFSSKDIYDPERISYDGDLLRQFYLRQGYIDFRLVSAVAELAPFGDNFFVTFTVDEGNRYKISDVDIEINVDELLDTDFTDQLLTRTGDWYSSTSVDLTVSNIVDMAGELGYAFIEVRPQVLRDEESSEISIKYELVEINKIYVERIDIIGNLQTMDDVIRREILLYEGDSFNAERLRRSHRRLFRLGFFDNVVITSNPGSADDKAVIQVEVSERATGTGSIGGGYSSSYGTLGSFSISENNFLGRGQQLSFSVLYATRRRDISLSFTEPKFLGNDFSAGIRLYTASEEYEDESSYNQSDYGFSLSGSYYLADDLSHTLIYSFRTANIEDVPVTASRFIKEEAEKGSIITSAIGQVLTYDRRDVPFRPTKGYILSIGTTFAGLGGNNKYFKLSGRAAYYFSLSPGWITRIGIRGGAIWGLGDNDVGVFDRFRLGGDRFRGFTNSGLGPRDLLTDDSLGGNYYYVMQAEQSIPLPFPAEIGLEGRYFIDAGSLFGIDNVIEETDRVGVDSAIRLSTGIGIAWSSPLGPMKLYYAWPLINQDYDRTEGLRFTFGTTF